ncbi:FkbM family methyltransferase [Variovorax sp. J22R133]|uniref:FkbM family methyltransferase n=1 Tax=Variovorax brevis TaxID=3053503 RepID=UPI00257554AF|nr:FkbM family methyltransferase [Variovorax sp. J22R133]MDM0116947.1 FkbM family methyltransferase [Variovorax sp. J22R133]
MLTRLWKPWFVHRPVQIGQRLYASLVPPTSGYKPLRTSWGATITADPTKTIGRNIVMTGLYDISVSEVLARLITPGATVIDAGANIGYMTTLAAMAAGAGGKVLSFEPHPELVKILRANVAAATLTGTSAKVEVYQSALGDEPGMGELALPEGFDGNDGIATMLSDVKSPVPKIRVRVQTLDEVLGEQSAEVLKLDVEGFEYHVLKGAEQALTSRRIRHVVFEEHDWKNSSVVRLLRETGYEVFSLGWTVKGLSLAPFNCVTGARPWESPSFVATIDPENMLRQCASDGWRVLRKNLQH